MDTNEFLKLLEQLDASGGGMVLKVGDASRAVILSMEHYTTLTGNTQGVLVDVPSSAEPNLITKTILLTGGAGYIGGHVSRVLLEAGYRLIILDNLHTGKQEYVPRDVTFVEGSILDKNLLQDIFASYKVDAVVHLAALLEVEESVREPQKYFEVNVQGTANLLEAMTAFGIKNLVFSSTASVYGSQVEQPIGEEVPAVLPTSPYGHTKLLAEKVIEFYTINTELKATILRFFNVAGRNPAWPVYDTHHNSHLIPIVLDVAQGLHPLLVVNGQDYETTDGTCVRDYVHVLDIAEAHKLALENQGGAKLNVYNVGTGHGSSVREVVQVAAEVTGHMIPMEVGPRRAGDDAQTVAKVDKIKAELGFTAKHSSLEQIIKDSWTGV